MKYSARSELFNMTDQMKEVVACLHFTIKTNLCRILSSSTAPGSCVLCSLKCYEALIVSSVTRDEHQCQIDIFQYSKQ